MKHKFKTSFAIKNISVDEGKKIETKASLDQIREFLPEVEDHEKDLLAISFNSSVVNTFNLNGDGIATREALEIADKFKNKQINLEHDRKNIVGFITNVGFSEFGSDIPLSREDIESKNDKSPFNIVLGGFLWEVANPTLLQMVKDSNDPESENYEKISASWEVAFSEFVVAETDPGSSDILGARIIDDEDEIFEIMDVLKGFGGSGTKNGRSYHRLIVGEDILPLGIGLTENPAAAVVGVAVKVEESEESEESEETEETEVVEEKNIKAEKETKQAEKSVKEFEMIDNISDITDESLKEGAVTAVSIATWSSDLVKEGIRKASDEYAQTLAEKDQVVGETLARVIELEKEIEAFKKEAEASTELLAETQLQLDAIANSAKIDERLAVIADKFDLSDSQEKSVVSKILGFSVSDDEAFASYVEELTLFCSPIALPEIVSLETQASVIDEAIDNGDQPQKAIATSSTEESMTQKYESSFKFGSKNDENSTIFLT
jgi:hypothetical protein